MHNHKEKHLNASVRHLVKTDIHHPKRIIDQSQIIKHTSRECNQGWFFSSDESWTTIGRKSELLPLNSNKRKELLG